MDLSLATDQFSNPYHYHHHHLQQQQQQQHQHQQALSLAPPTVKGFYDLESVEHTGGMASATTSIGMLPPPYQTEHVIRYPPTTATAAAPLPFQQYPYLDVDGSSRNHHHYHHHHLQQQQQQQQQQYQHQPALTLAPPTGKGFYDLESVDHTGRMASATTSIGMLPPPHQTEHAMRYPPTTATAAAAAAAPLPSQQYPASMMAPLPSHSPGHSWARNPAFSNNTHLPVQQAHFPLPAYNAEVHPGAAAVVDHSLQYSSLYGWGSEPYRSQWAQSWDYCLPPGVSQNTTAPAVGVDLRTARPAHMVLQKVWPKKKHNKNTEKKVPSVKTAVMKVSSVKTAVMKEAGPTRGHVLEKGPGWCVLCQRNCITEVALKQHLDGKGHKKQVERQKERAESAAKAADENRGGVATMLEQMWLQVSMMGKAAQTGKSHGRIEKRLKAEESLSNVMPSNALKGQEPVRCELCNVECNSRAILEIHFGGKKHVARLKKLQV